VQKWGDAYRRLREQGKFTAFFGQHCQVPGPNDFTFRAFTLIFSNVTGMTENGLVSSAPIFGPLVKIFDKGAVILGITSGAYQQQEVPAQANVPPSIAPSRRDMFRLYFQYTGDDELTQNSEFIVPGVGATNNNSASIISEALDGGGMKDEFPRDLICPPSTGFLVRVQSLIPAINLNAVAVPPLHVHVVFHTVVPKG
jgi:hypothetical protein